MKQSCEQCRAVIEAHFIGEKPLDLQGWESLKAHLQACSACRAYYDRLADAEALLAEGSDAVRPAQERLLGAILPQRRARRIWVLPAAVAACLLVVVGVLLPRQPGDNGGGFRARGSDKTPLVGLGVRALCLTADPKTDEWRAVALPHAHRRDEVGPGCPLNGELKFLYTTTDQGFGWLAIVGLSERGRLLRVLPERDEQHSLAIVPGAQERSVPRGVALAGERPGLVRVYALFSAKPLQLTEVVAALRGELSRIGQAPASLDLGPDIRQDGFWIRIAESTRPSDLVPQSAPK